MSPAALAWFPSPVAESSAISSWIGYLRTDYRDSPINESHKSPKNKELASERIFVEHLIRLIKIFRVAQERFRLNRNKYEQIIMTICGLVRLRIGTFIF
ncbi:MAG: transposase family protein [Nostoc sp.]